MTDKQAITGCFTCLHPVQLLDALNSNVRRMRLEGAHAAWRIADKMEGKEQQGPYKGLFDLNTENIARHHDVMGKAGTDDQAMDSPPVMTLKMLEKAMAEGGSMTRWEPRRWKSTKVLASAAAGIGRVDLMASQESPGCVTAVKRLPLRLLTNSAKSFQRLYPDATEHPWTDIGVMKHLNGLGFPYVCNLLGVFAGIEQAYIMTSFANAGDLFAWCQADKSQAGLEREVVMRPIVAQVFNAVRWLHNLGIAHRDLSLENVMLTRSKSGSQLQVKVIDFGMATLSRTATNEVRGKPSYQAPEMHGSGEYDTFLSDNFAVGVIVYCMAVQNYPWEETTPGTDARFAFASKNGMRAFLQQDIVQGVKKPVAEVFSKPLLEVLAGLLSIDPEKRYSLGEACLAHSVIKKVDSDSLLSEAGGLSDVSTTDSLSLCDTAPRLLKDIAFSEGEQSGSSWHVGFDDMKPQGPSLRVSVWHGGWPLAEDLPEAVGA